MSKLPPIAEEKSAPGRPGKLVALLQWGRSGTGFIHSLMDGHPSVMTLPGYYLAGFFDQSVWKDLASSDPGDMARKFVELHPILFDAANPAPIPGIRHGDTYNVGVNEGYTVMGPGKDQCLGLDKSVFSETLSGLLADRGDLSQARFFELLHQAFEMTLGRYQGQDLIFYHLHNPGSYELLNTLHHFPHSKFLLAVREPLRSCESWMDLTLRESTAYSSLVNALVESLFKFDQVVFRRHDSRGVRLEDITSKTSGALESLCQWLEIDMHGALTSSTFQGLEWWGDPSTVRFGRTEPVHGFTADAEASPNKREPGYLFSDNDQLVLNTLFYPVQILYGYRDRDDDAFKRDLETIRPLIGEPFDFEKSFMETALPDHPNPERNAHFRMLRAALKDRWDVLEKFGTYPDMIDPLLLS